MSLSGPLSSRYLTPSVPVVVSTLNDGLISYYDSDGTDRVGSNNFTPTGGPTTGVGKVSASCIDVTTSQYFTLADVDAADFEPDKTFTISFWFNSDSLGATQRILGKSTAYRVFLSSTGTMTYRMGGDITEVGLSASTWYHCIIDFDQPNTDTHMWIDGASSGIQNTTGAGNTPDPFRFGADEIASAFQFAGLLDQFCLWHRLLTTDEIAELYNGGAGTDFLSP